MMNNDSCIDILCVYDDHHKCLYDMFFYPTYEKYLSSSFNIKPIYKLSKYESTGYNSKNWSEILINRFILLKDYIKNNLNKWAIFSDIDVIFFGDFIQHVNHIIKSSTNKIFYTSEFGNMSQRNLINGGFFLFYCDDFVSNFFDLIIQETKKMQNPNDQIFITDYLKQNQDLPIDLLPSDVFLANNIAIQENFFHIKRGTAKVFHATSAYSIYDKLQVLSTVYTLTQPSAHKSRLWR